MYRDNGEDVVEYIDTIHTLQIILQQAYNDLSVNQQVISNLGEYFKLLKLIIVFDK